MNYYLNLFSHETFEAFRNKGSEMSGFQKTQRTQASKIEEGSIMLCYMVKLSRWVGALKTVSKSFESNEPYFKDHEDPFTIRFKVEPLVILDIENSIPIIEDDIWNNLIWTKDKERGTIGWAGNLQRSLRIFPSEDGDFLYNKILNQKIEKKIYPLNDKEKKILESKAVHIIDKSGNQLSVEIPEDEIKETAKTPESLTYQKLIAEIGVSLGYKIWIPKTDRTRLGEEIDEDLESNLVTDITIPFEPSVKKIIENIDVIWMKDNSIIKAFEIEHSTSVYSGLLRMSDLNALVPNLSIDFYIVAPGDRSEKVIKEIRRPTFRKLLGNGCHFITYESVHQINELPLKHSKSSILNDYTETVEDI